MSKKSEDDFKSPFIPISELGMSEDGFMINTRELYDALYESYCACCQSPDADSVGYTEQDYGKEGPLSAQQLAVTGRAGQYMWHALTCIFDESIHQMDDFKRMHNEHHIDAACDMLESPSNNLQHAINNDMQLVSMCKTPVVISITEYSNYFANDMGMYSNHLNYLHHMAHFFETELLDGVFTHITKNDGTKVVRINPSLIKDKDVIIPQIFATRGTIDLFKRVSKFLCKNGAKSVQGLFITRIKPTSDGVEPKRVNDKYTIQPLGPRFFGGLGIPCF